MLFNSFIFILLFLPVCLIGYFGLNHFRKYKSAKAFLLGMSLWFYGYFQISYLLILAGSILVNYILYRLIRRAPGQARGADPAGEPPGGTCREQAEVGSRNAGKALMILGVMLNLGVLGYFKYMDFFLENINALFRTHIPLPGILLPLGISFFTFQQVGFIIDTYRREAGEYSFLDYALFVSFFPQLIAGPIVTHQELIPQLQSEEKKHLRADHFSEGCVSFILGLAKKVLLADVLAQAVEYGYGHLEALNSVSAVIVMLSYYFEIYFDFSGYSDMAIGLGKMLNLELPVNFNSPYKGRTVREFWKRWHITLTRFFTKYVYIPLGGSRNGALRTYWNTILIFLLSGIWHGAGWGYVIWGLSGGIGIVLCRIFEKQIDAIGRKKAGSVFLWILNLVYISVFWVFFKTGNVHTAAAFFSRLFHGGISMPGEALLQTFRVDEFWYLLKILHMTGSRYADLLLCTGYLAASFVIVLALPNVHEKVQTWKPKAWHAVLLAFLFLWSFVSLAGVSTFIYYNF